VVVEIIIQNVLDVWCSFSVSHFLSQYTRRVSVGGAK
jgi:hypothetical protein